MFINDENLPTQSNLLQQNKYLRFDDFLKKGFADQIYKCLAHEIDWGIACHLNGKSTTFLKCNDINNLSVKNQAILKLQLKEPFHFIYNTYMIVTSYLEQREPGHFLYTVLEWLNSIETIQYFRKLINDDKLIKINAQATRYLPNHFLKQHNDENSEEGRLCTYVSYVSPFAETERLAITGWVLSK